MKKSRHTDEQIVKILREADETTIAETARKHSITDQTIYRWRRLYDGMQVNDVKELKGLRDENTRLKKLLAERDLELDVMKEINEKKW
jgi:transposase-like protein